VSAAIVWREQLDVLMEFPAIDLALDAVVREVHMVIEVPEIVFACPLTDLVLITARPAVAVGSSAVGLLQELLVLALQILFEDDAPDLEVRVLVSKAGFLLPKCRAPRQFLRGG
jgi:hypothetical protein